MICTYYWLTKDTKTRVELNTAIATEKMLEILFEDEDGTHYLGIGGTVEQIDQILAQGRFAIDEKVHS